MKRLFLEPLKNFWENFLDFLPNLIAFFFILIFGVVISLLLRFILKKFLVFIKIDDFSKKQGMEEILSKSGIQENFSSFISKIFGWFIFLAFFIISLDALKIEVIHSLLEKFFLYIPNLFIASIILFFGFLLSGFFSRAILIALVNEGYTTAGIISKVVKVLIIFISFSMALEQLGIGKETVIIAFAIIFGGFIFGFSLAFGLGGKDLAKNYLEKIMSEEKKEDKIKHL